MQFQGWGWCSNFRVSAGWILGSTWILGVCLEGVCVFCFLFTKNALFFFWNFPLAKKLSIILEDLSGARHAMHSCVVRSTAVSTAVGRGS